MRYWISDYSGKPNSTFSGHVLHIYSSFAVRLEKNRNGNDFLFSMHRKIYYKLVHADIDLIFGLEIIFEDENLS